MRDETPNPTSGLPSAGRPRGLGPASPVGTGAARCVSRCPPGWGRVRVWCTQGRAGCGDGAKFGPGEAEAGAAPAPSGPAHPQAPRSLPRWARSGFYAGLAPNPASKRVNGNASPLATWGRLGSAGKRARKEGGRGEKGEFGFLSVPSLLRKKPFFSPKQPPSEQSEVTRRRARGRTAPSDLRTGPGNRPRGSES